MATARHVVGRVIAALAFGAVLAACAGSPGVGPTGAPSTSSPASAPNPATSIATATVSAATGPVNQKVLVIVDENHTQAQAQAEMPFLVGLQSTFGVTSNYTSPTHPSLPNYLLIAGGSAFGVTDDAAPSSHPITGTSVFGAALSQGRTARTYNEAMTTNCELTASGDYAVKHNPWAYFVDERTACQTNDVPLTALSGDIDSAALPNVGMITPNMCNDGHDCPLEKADAFLRTWVPQLMNGPDYRNGDLTIVVTFDEGVRSEQTIQTVVITPAVKAAVVTAALTHAGLSRWLYRVSGSTPQHDAATAADVGAAFGL
jgi:acid phosphatase